jgi:hypothetical protein
MQVLAASRARHLLTGPNNIFPSPPDDIKAHALAMLAIAACATLTDVTTHRLRLTDQQQLLQQRSTRCSRTSGCLDNNLMLSIVCHIFYFKKNTQNDFNRKEAQQ